MNSENQQPLLMARPALDEEKAWKLVRIRSPYPPFRKIKIVKLELIHLPHYQFKVELTVKGQTEVVELVVDAITGQFAHWRPAELALEPASVKARELPFLITPEEAQERMIADYRWALIGAGLKLRKRFSIKRALTGPRIYYPFWVGYYYARGLWKFEVIDAVSGMRQGGKVRDAVLAALVHQNQNVSSPLPVEVF